MEPKIIELPKLLDDRGNLTFIESKKQIPFDIKRAYWIYDVPSTATRGGHAYKTLNELVVALSGSFTVTLTDARGNSSEFFLNKSNIGLYIPAMNWRELKDFSTNSLAFVLADDLYDENDYIYDSNNFFVR